MFFSNFGRLSGINPGRPGLSPAGIKSDSCALNIALRGLTDSTGTRLFLRKIYMRRGFP
jgi:hypothetical protein